MSAKKPKVPQPQKANETSFKIGNSASIKWTTETATELLAQMYDNAFNNDTVLCLQDAYLQLNIRHSTFEYILGKFPDLAIYKKDIQNVILARINKGALLGDFVATPAIWRSKQLGETDMVQQDITTNGKDINTSLHFTADDFKE